LRAVLPRISPEVLWRLGSSIFIKPTTDHIEHVFDAADEVNDFIHQPHILHYSNWRGSEHSNGITLQTVSFVRWQYPLHQLSSLIAAQLPADLWNRLSSHRTS
jgi:hypothetical protein